MSRTLLVTQKGCPGCEGVKDSLSGALASGEITEVPITSEKGEIIQDLLNIDWVPECVTENDDGSFTKCSLDDLIKKKGKK